MLAAALALTAFGTAISPPVSDGVRWTAIQRSATTIEIRDDAYDTGARLDVPCRPVSITPEGSLLTACPDRYVIVDLATGGQTSNVAPPGAAVLAAGTHWLEERQNGSRRYVNRDTGEVTTLDVPDQHANLGALFGLGRPLCAPLRRVSERHAADAALYPADTWASFTSFQEFGDSAYAVSEASAAVLWRCGRAKPERIAGATGISVGGGYASWTKSRRAVVERLGDGRHISARAPVRAAVHTQRALYGFDGKHVLRAAFPTTVKGTRLHATALGSALGHLVSDGDRWVAVQRAASAIEIRDEAKGLKRLLSLPCAPVSISPAGVLLTACGHDSAADATDYAAVDLRTHAIRRFTVAEELSSGFTDAIAAGRHWVLIQGDSEHVAFRYYRNLDTGERRDDTGSREAADLDAASLTRPFCSPLRRALIPGTDESEARLVDASYPGGAAAVVDSQLWFCGDERPHGGGRETTVGGGWASWESSSDDGPLSDMVAERLSDRRRFVLPFGGETVVHTRRALYVLGEGRVYRAKLPT